MHSQQHFFSAKAETISYGRFKQNAATGLISTLMTIGPEGSREP